MAKRCIIVGGGVAGLAAGSYLAAWGWQVGLYERRPTLAGRAGGYRDRETGDTLDTGPHLIAGCYHETFRFLRQIGARKNLNLSRKTSVAYVYPGGRTEMLDGGWWPGPFHLLKALACFGALSLRARMRLLRIAPALLAIRLGGSSHLRGLCVREWLRQEGQDEETIRVLWDPLILACLNTPPKEAAAEVFAQVAAHLFTGGRKNACFGTGHYGLEALLGTPARTFIENHGGEVHTRTAVRKIRIENRRVTGICLADGSWQTADAYILAVPPPAVLSLLPESEKTREPFSALHNYEPSAICTLYLWTDREITSLPFAHMRTRRFEWIFNLQAMMPRQKFSGPVYGLENSAADWMMPWTHKQMIEAAREDIEACFPDAKGFQILHTSISKDRQATFQAVPSLEARRLSAATPLDNLFLAGDWTRTGYPGTIEGAVKSGRRCANAIHAEFEQKGKIHAANKAMPLEHEVGFWGPRNAQKTKRRQFIRNHWRRRKPMKRLRAHPHRARSRSSQSM